MALVERSEPRRVVVTGIGMVTNLGKDSTTSIKNLLDGRSGISHLSFEHPDIKLGGEIHDFDPSSDLKGIIDKKLLKRLPYAGYYSLKATDEALSEAGLLDEKRDLIPDLSREKIGVYIGTAVGGTFDEDIDNPKMKDKTSGRDPYPVLRVLPERVASGVEIRYGIEGSTLSHVAACSSGGEAIGAAAVRLASGQYPERIMLAGGAEAAITPRFLEYFNLIGAVSKSQDDANISYPFDVNRNGFHMAEGAAVLVLEDLEHALQRGATPIVEVVGYGSAADGASDTLSTGKGLQKAMEQALRGISNFPRAGDIYVVKPHVTATPKGDGPEADAIQRVFPDYKQVFAHAAKGAEGHTLGASGAIATAEAARGLYQGFIPPNHHKKLMEGVFFHLPTSAQQVTAELALVNASGFGGLNCSLALKRISL